MARPMGSWMSGPEPGSGSQDRSPSDDPGYPGQRLGLPQTGRGSIASFGRRLLALLIDWFIAYGLTGLAVTFGLLTRSDLLYSQIGSAVITIIWLVLGVVAVRLFGFTPGQLALGIRVLSVDGEQHVGLGRAIVRGLLVLLVIPALFTDSDYRGLQDLTTKTAVVRR